MAREMDKSNANWFIAVLLAVMAIVAAGFLLSRSARKENASMLPAGGGGTGNVQKEEVSQDVAGETAQVSRTLRIDSRKCIGCGKCVRVDAEHFMMQGGIAQVMTQDNLDTEKLDVAVKACPTNAILAS